MRMQIRTLTRWTNAFTKKLGKPLGRALLALRRVHLLPGPDDPENHTGHGAGSEGSRLVHRRMTGDQDQDTAQFDTPATARLF